LGELGDFHVGGGGLEALLAVLEDFDEVVEGFESGFDVGVHGFIFWEVNRMDPHGGAPRLQHMT